MTRKQNSAAQIDLESIATVRAFKRAISPVSDRIFIALEKSYECGPFDGGCVAFARALQQVIGGEVAVVLRAGTQRADHAAVYKDGRLIDFDGPALPAAFCRRFSRNEHVNVDGWRLWQDGDLHEAVTYKESLERKLVALLKEAFLVQPASAKKRVDHVASEPNVQAPKSTTGMSL
jgi:hypothetical protein